MASSLYMMKLIRDKLKPPALTDKDLYRYINNPYWKVDMIGRSPAEVYLKRDYSETH